MKMWRRLYKAIIILSCANIQAKEPELPLCPTNMQFFPQNLPMHCRMPVGSTPETYQNAAGKQPQQIPMPLPAIAGGISGSFQGAIPSGLPGPMAMQMPMMPMPSPPAQKLPVIVMPFYSQDTSAKTSHSPSMRPRHKKRRRRPKPIFSSDEDSTDTDTSSDDSSDRSSDLGWWKMSREGRRSNRHKSKRRQHQKKPLLTPVLQYVTKDGYVIFEKQISKGEAQDWLGNKNTNKNEIDTLHKDEYDRESNEPKNGINTSVLKKKDHVEITSEVNHHSNHRKRSSKRKLGNKDNMKR